MEFREDVIGDEGEFGNFITVESDGNFIRILESPEEGTAQMHWSVAKKLIPILEKLVEIIEIGKE